MKGVGNVIDVFAGAETLTREQLSELVDIFAALEPDARELVLMNAQRLMAGQRQYGRIDLDTDRRNFVREALEEAVDANTYLMSALKRLVRRSEVQP